jgi:hypothetical protein
MGMGAEIVFKLTSPPSFLLNGCRTSEEKEITSYFRNKSAEARLKSRCFLEEGVDLCVVSIAFLEHLLVVGTCVRGQACQKRYKLLVL